MKTYEITVKLKSYLYVRPVNIFPNFSHCFDHMSSPVPVKQPYELN